MKVIVLTDRTLTGGRQLADVVRGAPAVILREKDLPRNERARLAAELRPLVDVLIVAGTEPIAGADGLHLPSRGNGLAKPQAIASGSALVGRSCHSREDLEAAAAEGCHYATLSPIFASASKPGYGPALGTDALNDSPLPVYALGGVDTTNARSCIHAGAAGVAVMGAVMRAADPQRVLEELLA